MLGDPPIIADFNIPGLGITLKDYRTRPTEDHRAAIEKAAAEAKEFVAQDSVQTFVLCSEDERTEPFRRQAFRDAKAAGLVSNFQELDALGLGVVDDYACDARYPDQNLLIYHDDVLIGSFVLLKLRFRSSASGKLRARATPWPALNAIPGRSTPAGVIWAQLMNYLLDTDLTLVDSSDVLDIVEWIFPVDRPELDMFTHSNTPGHRLAGLKAAATQGRDLTVHPGSGIHRHIRRRGEVWTPEE
jgi:hypothetical protein